MSINKNGSDKKSVAFEMTLAGHSAPGGIYTLRHEGSYLPDDRNNVAGKSRVDAALMGSADWISAKERFDVNAADRIIDNLWSDKKTQQLKSFFKDMEQVVFITQPSTSRTNALPIRLAQRLSAAFRADYILGEDHYDAIHSRQSKHISRLNRPFHKREYASIDIEAFKGVTRDKHLVIVEDVLTTGGSVAEFSRQLHRDGFHPESIVTLMGDKRLRLDQKTNDRLEQALQGKNIPLTSHDLSGSLTRAEAGGLIMLINQTRSEHGIRKLTENLRGLSDRGVAFGLGGTEIQRGYESTQGKDQGNEQLAERIQSWAVSDPGKGGVGEGASAFPLPPISEYASQKNAALALDRRLGRNDPSSSHKKEPANTIAMAKEDLSISR